MGRRLGQHFLHSQSVLDGIVAQAALQPGEPVLEVGPGPGALTERLLAARARVTAVEVDPVLA
ncbi:MAG TPA: rRNA adenine N-6-methyltransferase family protein, partial [bacterium]